MPVRSKAQSRKFFAMASRGEISKGTLREWTHGVDVKRLPERKGKDMKAAWKKRMKKAK